MVLISISQYIITMDLITWFNVQVYVPQNTTVPQNTSFFISLIKLLNINELIKAKHGYFHRKSYRIILMKEK